MQYLSAKEREMPKVSFVLDEKKVVTANSTRAPIVVDKSTIYLNELLF